jgi:ferrous iron transport protein B
VAKRPRKTVRGARSAVRGKAGDRGASAGATTGGETRGRLPGHDADPAAAHRAPRTADRANDEESQLANSALGYLGRAIEPAVRPLGFDWKIGVSIISSFAAREVFVSTMGTIYGVGADDGATLAALPDRLRAERDAGGRPAYTTLTAIGLMVFYVFALMCMSTVAVTVREAGGGRQGWAWAALQFGYMLVLAYVGAWLVRQIGLSLGFGG